MEKKILDILQGLEPGDKLYAIRVLIAKANEEKDPSDLIQEALKERGVK